MRILIVDDEPASIWAIEQQLKVIGEQGLDEAVETVGASSLTDALVRVGMGGWDAVTLDLKLPDSLDPRETIARFAAVMAHVPVVIISGTADKVVSREAIRAGADDYVTKDDLERTPIAVFNAIARWRQDAEITALNERVSQMSAKLDELLQALGNKEGGDVPAK
jgi:CheY-like chemotaxis protein